MRLPFRTAARTPPFCTWLLERGPVEARTLGVLDVGCREGLPEWLHPWPGVVTGVAIDPDREEIERLQRQGRWPQVRFQAGWVGATDFEAALPEGYDRARWRAFNNRSWRRTSSALAQEVLALRVPPGDPGQQSAPPPVVSLDALGDEMDQVDLLKVDTDGHDLEVLSSGPRTVARALAVAVEVQFQGPSHTHANVFGNVDQLLREAGFELYDLRVHRHSRAALPAPFWGKGGSPTFGGQTVWGEAFYARDPLYGPPVGARRWTLAALLELAALPDCAVELLQQGGDGPEVEAATRALARGWWRDGGAWARETIRVHPSALHPLRGAPVREWLRRLGGRIRWAPWRG